MTVELRTSKLDQERADALRRIWFVGDVHGHFKHLVPSVEAVQDPKAKAILASRLDAGTQFLRQRQAG